MRTTAKHTEQANPVHKREIQSPGRTEHEAPSPGTRVLALQRLAGNGAVSRALRGRTLQTKMAVSRPGDSYEREADRAAEMVLLDPAPGRVATATRTAVPLVGRMCDECEQEKRL